MTADDACSSCISRRALIGAALGTGALSALPASDAAASTTQVDAGAASSVPVGGGRIVTLRGVKVVVTQPKRGTYRAFSARCTHQGCTVTGVSRNQISCPCHGAKFNTTTGRPISGPASAPLTSYPVTVRNRRLLVAMPAPSASAAAPSPSASVAAEIPAGFTLLSGAAPTSTGASVLRAGDKRVLVVRDAQGTRAFDARCPHQGFQGWEFVQDKGVVQCQRHFNEYSVSTGKGTNNELALRAIPLVETPQGLAADVRQL